jgi:hypothetical protein
MIQSNSAPTKRRILVKHPLTRITPIVGITALALLSCVPSFGATTEWKIDPQHSAAQFSVRHLAISTVRGAFNRVTGTVLVDDRVVTIERDACRRCDLSLIGKLQSTILFSNLQ